MIDEAIREAEEQGVKGKDITPFLLSRVKDLTEGRSLEPIQAGAQQRRHRFKDRVQYKIGKTAADLQRPWVEFTC